MEATALLTTTTVGGFSSVAIPADYSGSFDRIICYDYALDPAAGPPRAPELLRTTTVSSKAPASKWLTHTNAYIALINGLVADGVFPGESR